MTDFASAVPGLHSLRAADVQHCAYYSDITVPRACGDRWQRLLLSLPGSSRMCSDNVVLIGERKLALFLAYQ